MNVKDITRFKIGNFEFFITKDSDFDYIYLGKEKKIMPMRSDIDSWWLDNKQRKELYRWYYKNRFKHKKKLSKTEAFNKLIKLIKNKLRYQEGYTSYATVYQNYEMVLNKKEKIYFDYLTKAT